MKLEIRQYKKEDYQYIHNLHRLNMICYIDKYWGGWNSDIFSSIPLKYFIALVEVLLFCIRRQQAISSLPSVLPAATTHPYLSLCLTQSRHRRPSKYWKQLPSAGELVTGLCSRHTPQMASLA